MGIYATATDCTTRRGISCDGDSVLVKGEGGGQRPVRRGGEDVACCGRHGTAGVLPDDEGVAGIVRGGHDDRRTVIVRTAAADRAARGRVGGDGDGVLVEGEGCLLYTSRCV